MTHSQLENITWDYPLVEISQDKRSSRTGTTPGFAADLIGVSGELAGGQRVSPGFRKVHSLDPLNEVLNPNIGTGSHWSGTPQPNYWVDDIWAVDFRVGEKEFAYGFVYRVKYADSGTDLVDNVMIDYRIGTDATWYTRTLHRAVPKDSQMSVTVRGRLVYVFIEKRLPILFYLESGTPSLATSSSNWAPSSSTGTLPDFKEVLVGGEGTAANGITGPGTKPTLKSHRERANNNIGSATTSQMYITDVAPQTLNIWGPTSSSSGAVSAPQSFPDVQRLKRGDYSFAIHFYDSKTGLRSALSEIATLDQAEFSKDELTSFSLGSSFSSLSSKFDAIARGGAYGVVELIYDETRWDQAFVYRSVRIQGAGGTHVAAILHLDAIIDLEDYKPAVQPAGDDARAVYYYEKKDKELVFSDRYEDDADFSEIMPPGGAGLWYENTMLVSKITTFGESETPLFDVEAFISPWAIGELRWSSLAEANPELFNPNNRYLPSTPSNEIIRLVKVNGSVLGFSRDREYLIRKESNYLKIHEMHEGFGITNPKALDVVGSYVYFISEKGLKAVDDRGQLEDVNAINQLIIESWRGNLDDAEVVFDPLSSIVFVHSESDRQTCLFWLNTSSVTMLNDTPFQSTSRGSFPQDPSDSTSTLTKRAFFLHTTRLSSGTGSSGPSGDKIGAGTQGEARIYVYDYDRAKTISGATANNGSTRTTLMDITGDSVVEVFGASSTAIQTINGTLGSNLEDAFVYVLDGTNVGEKTRIKYKSSGSVLEVDDGSMFEAGDTIGISPVYTRVTGWQLGLKNAEGFSFGNTDFFRQFKASSMAAVFVDVSGAQSGTTNALYRALIYRGTETTPKATAVPRDNDDNIVTSVAEYDPKNYAAFHDDSDAVLSGKFGYRGPVLFPSVEVFCPDLDYRLISMRVRGSIEGTDRATRST